MTEQELKKILDDLLKKPKETEWLEFKQAARNYPFDKLGRYFSALSNEARLKDQAAGWLVFGIQDKTRKISGTRFPDQRRARGNMPYCILGRVPVFFLKS